VALQTNHLSSATSGHQLYTPEGQTPRALDSVNNDDELCPKPAYLQALWIIGKRAFETDYCASLPGTAILTFKPRENPVNVG
jgi:hypothetical protein